MKHVWVIVCLWGLTVSVAGCHEGHDCDKCGGGGVANVPNESEPDGAICDGTYYCPAQQIPVLEGPVGAEVCFCRYACDPDAADATCPAGRVCVQLEDEVGNPLVGEGSCEPEYQGALGEPCAPQQCQGGFICSGYTADTSYCREQCDADGACLTGYDCTPVSEYGDPSIKVCMPIVGEAAEGEACSLAAPCQAELFCTSTAAGAACRVACDPWVPLCPAEADCLPVADPQGATYGFACTPRI